MLTRLWNAEKQWLTKTLDICCKSSEWEWRAFYLKTMLYWKYSDNCTQKCPLSHQTLSIKLILTSHSNYLFLLTNILNKLYWMTVHKHLHFTDNAQLDEWTPFKKYNSLWIVQRQETGSFHKKLILIFTGFTEKAILRKHKMFSRSFSDLTTEYCMKMAKEITVGLLFYGFPWIWGTLFFLEHENAEKLFLNDINYSIYIPTHLEKVHNPLLSFIIYIVKFIQSIMSDRQFTVREVTRHDQCKD